MFIFSFLFLFLFAYWNELGYTSVGTKEIGMFILRSKFSSFHLEYIRQYENRIISFFMTTIEVKNLFLLYGWRFSDIKFFTLTNQCFQEVLESDMEVVFSKWCHISDLVFLSGLVSTIQKLVSPYISLLLFHILV